MATQPGPGAAMVPDAATVAVIACGALAGHIRQIAAARGWPVEVHALPALLHNRPGQIAPAVAQLAAQLQARGRRVAVAYADCGSYGVLDEVCSRLGLRRLPGLHCYDVLGGADRVRELLAAEAGTYLLTDFLVRSFSRSVLAELGLDRHPQLWPDYFGHYRRVVWLAQSRDAGLEQEANAVAAMFGLPLTVVDVGTAGLEQALGALLAGAAAGNRADAGARNRAGAGAGNRADADAGAQAGAQSAMILERRGQILTPALQDHEAASACQDAEP